MDTDRQEFGRYVLDLRRGCLLLDGREITLRPTTFAVLTYLAARPGQLISKEELAAAVWPNLDVNDDTLVQSIGELRHALGEHGPRMIATVSRGGYRFDPSAAPADRRKSGIWHALRWRWKYGILAPLAVMVTFMALWFGMRGCGNLKQAAADARPAIADPPVLTESPVASASQPRKH